MNRPRRKCEQCASFIQWVEYGNVLGDCRDVRAFPFIRATDGVEDPAEAGCPYFEMDKPAA